MLLQLHTLTIEGMDRVRDIVARYSIDCDWIEGGVVYGLLYKKEEEGMLTAAQVNQIMGRNDNNNVNGLLDKSGGYDLTCGAVNPLRLMLGLAAVVEQWGVHIYENTKVVKLELCSSSNSGDVGEDDKKGKYSIVTNCRYVVRCDHVVLCTGAGTLSTDISR